MPLALVDLQTLIRDAGSLEPLPASAARLASLVARPEPDLEAIVEVVRLDEALTGRLLMAANSAISGPRVEISSVDRAVLRLGPGSVLAFAIGSAVSGPMRPALEAYGLAEGELWRHSVASALAIDRARAHCRRPIPAGAFPAALLHDVGKLVLGRNLSEPARELVRRACTELGYSREEAEVEILHVCHARVGAMVAESWRLPEVLVEAIRFHHRPLGARHEATRLLCHQIALAEAVAVEVGAGAGDDDAHAFHAGLAGTLGITRAGFEALALEVAEALDDVLAIYG